jgi:hypothetical protein
MGDDCFLGLLPMLRGPRSKRPPIVCFGTSILHWPREDGAPEFLGLTPATTQVEREEYAAIALEHDIVVNQPLVRRSNHCLEILGMAPLSTPLFETQVKLADAYLQLTVPSRVSTCCPPGYPTIRWCAPHHTERGAVTALGPRVGRHAQSGPGHPRDGGQPRFQPPGHTDSCGAGRSTRPARRRHRRRSPGRRGPRPHSSQCACITCGEILRAISEVSQHSAPLISAVK